MKYTDENIKKLQLQSERLPPVADGNGCSTHSQTLGGERSQAGGLHWDPPLEAQGNATERGMRNCGNQRVENPRRAQAMKANKEGS